MKKLTKNSRFKIGYLYKIVNDFGIYVVECTAYTKKYNKNLYDAIALYYTGTDEYIHNLVIKRAVVKWLNHIDYNDIVYELGKKEDNLEYYL